MKHIYKYYRPLLALVLITCMVWPLSVSAGTPTRSDDASMALADGLTYLQGVQRSDGGLEGYTAGSSDVFTTIKAVIALAAAGYPQAALTTTGGITAVDYLYAEADGYVHDGSSLLFPGRAGMLAVGVVAGGGDPADFGGVDLVGGLNASYHEATGTYSTTAASGYTTGDASVTNQVWAMLGLAAAQAEVPSAAADWLVAAAETGGGWGYGSGMDIDLTAMAVQALVAAGVSPTDDAVVDGLALLRDAQATTGGWESWGSLSADSTAAVMQAAAAVGQTPTRTSWATSTGSSPESELLGLQAGDGSWSTNALGTAHAMAGLAEAALPIPGPEQRARLALDWLLNLQNSDGSWSGWSGADPGTTCDVVMALASAGYNPATAMGDGVSASAMDYLADSAATYAGQGADSAGKLALTVSLAGLDPNSFGGVNLVEILSQDYYSATLGGFGVVTNTWQQAYPLLGLAAAGELVTTTVPAAIQTLQDLQELDGGWKYDQSESAWNTTGADNTGLALQALIASGVATDDATVTDGVSFLSNAQDSAGGWSNANSTAYAIQGLLAAGEDLDADWTQSGHGPYQALATYQKTDGPFVWQWSSPTDNLLAAAQAVPALLGVAYPADTGAFTNWADVTAPADADRTVPSDPWGIYADGDLNVTVPVGSDANDDVAVTCSWARMGASPEDLSLTAATGGYTATLSGVYPGRYLLTATWTDNDGVQGESTLSAVVTIGQVVVTPWVCLNAE